MQPPRLNFNYHYLSLIVGMTIIWGEFTHAFASPIPITVSPNREIKNQTVTVTNANHLISTQAADLLPNCDRDFEPQEINNNNPNSQYSCQDNSKNNIAQTTSNEDENNPMTLASSLLFAQTTCL